MGLIEDMKARTRFRGGRANRTDLSFSDADGLAALYMLFNVDVGSNPVIPMVFSGKA